MNKKIKNISESKLLLKNGQILNILDGKSSNQDILIEDGKIVEIGKIEDNDNFLSIDCSKKIITQAFIDTHTHFKTPGIGDEETFISGSNAALSGGYSQVCIMPDSEPIIDNPELIKFIFDKSSNLPINIFPICAITKQLNGIDIAELGSMVNSGAIAMSDASNTIMNSQVTRYAIEYAKMFNVPFINHPENIELVNQGAMNESITSNSLGLSGNPSISESIMVYRDLEITKYVNGKIHIPSVTCSESVNLINNYKDQKIDVTCEVSPQHLFFNDKDLEGYDSNLKISPPLRNVDDIDNLIKGIKDGVIDCIGSNHLPIRFDNKDRDFYHAKAGVISLETAFSATNTILSRKNFSIESILNLFSLNPSKIMNLELCDINIGSNAELVIIDPNKKWIFTDKDIYSKSQNTPFINKELKGKVEFTINKTFLFG
jgi:dihydroorotase